MNRKMFHTQEHREYPLSQPVICTRDDAWLGDGYYFWYSEDDAHMWGRKSKRATGKYEIYVAQIDCANVLDTVFNEEHYLFWLRQIEKVAKKVFVATGKKPTIKEVNDYFKERGQWDKVDGIMFQDLSTNPTFLMVQPIQHAQRSVAFAYKKRIQLAVYALSAVKNFVFLLVDTCD